MNSATLYGRVTMDPAAFARFCETSSSAWCADDPSSGPGHIAVDGNSHRISLTAEWLMMRDRQLLPDLHKAAQAGRVDGVFMSACVDGDTNIEVVVFRNSETWAGWDKCLNNPVDIGPCTLRRVEVLRGDTLELFHRVDGSATKHRVSRIGETQACACGGYDDDGDQICPNVEKRYEDGDVSIIDIDTFMPPFAPGRIEQALIDAAGFVGPDGQRQLGRLVRDVAAAGWFDLDCQRQFGRAMWNVTGLEEQGMFRRWLETIEEATGERHATWVPDISDIGWRFWVDGPAATFNKRPVCTNTGVAQRGPFPGFLISDTATPDTIRVPAHVDNVSLSDATKLVADGADPAEMAEAVAVIAAITHPDRR